MKFVHYLDSVCNRLIMNAVRKSLNKRFERYNEFQPQMYPSYFFGEFFILLNIHFKKTNLKKKFVSS